MMNRTYSSVIKALFGVSLTIQLMSSCNSANQSEKILESFDSINRSLERTGELTHTTTATLYDSLQQYGDSILLGKFSSLKSAMTEFYDYTDELLKRLYVFAGDKEGKALPPTKENDLKLVKEFFDRDTMAINYETVINRTKKEMLGLAINESTKEHVRNITPPQSDKNKTEDYFRMLPAIAAVTTIRAFESQFRNSERQILFDELSKLKNRIK